MSEQRKQKISPKTGVENAQNSFISMGNFLPNASAAEDGAPLGNFEKPKEPEKRK